MKMSESTSRYAKLKDGNWGVRISGVAPKPGDEVTVTKRDGSTKVETISKVIFSGADKYHEGQSHLCEIKGVRKRAQGTKTCWECGKQFTLEESKTSGGDWSESYCGC
jgi:hypothetical protein